MQIAAAKRDILKRINAEHGLQTQPARVNLVMNPNPQTNKAVGAANRDSYIQKIKYKISNFGGGSPEHETTRNIGGASKNSSQTPKLFGKSKGDADKQSVKQKNMSENEGETMSVNPDESIPEFQNNDTSECMSCGRSFNSERIDKHSQICKGTRSRPVFDLKKQRLKGTEMENFKPTAPLMDKKTSNKVKCNARIYLDAKMGVGVGGKIDRNQPPLLPTKDGLEPCIYCKRNFNEQALERHLPICFKIMDKKNFGGINTHMKLKR